MQACLLAVTQDQASGALIKATPVDRGNRARSLILVTVDAPGSTGVKNGEKWKVLRMRFSIAENVCTPSDSLLSTSRASQLPYGEK